MTRLTSALLATSLLFVGCSASDPNSDEPQETRVRKKKKKKKKKKKRKRTQPVEERVPTVMFTVKKVGLRKVLLPMFLEQAGVKIKWNGDERQISLRLTSPIPWRNALDLVCQFTNTHLTTDYQGRYILKNGWGGTLGGDAELEVLAEKQGRGGRKGSSKKSGRRGRGVGVADSEGSAYKPSPAPSVKYGKGTMPGDIWGKVGDGR